MRFIAFLALSILLSGCTGHKKLSEERYARFYARKTLVEQYYQGQRDSIDFRIAALYQSEKVTPAQIREFLAGLEKNPKGWISLQEHIVRELKTLDPRVLTGTGEVEDEEDAVHRLRAASKPVSTAQPSKGPAGRTLGRLKTPQPPPAPVRRENH